MNIITVTLNPALDVHLEVDALRPSLYHTARLIRRDSAGKGVNLSRALTSNGVENLCYLVLGREGSEDFLAPLYDLGMRLSVTLTDGRVRENLNIHHGETETVIATSGTAVSAAEISDMEDKLIPEIREGTLLAFSGSISGGSDKERILSSLFKFRALGAKLIIDSKSLTLEEIVALKPFLIKPNEEEAEALSGMKVSSTADAVKAASAICDMGVENVLLTLGGSGAVLATRSAVYIAKVPPVAVLSTVGAGDSSIAGALDAISRGRSYPETLALAMAYGSAACMTEGSLPPRSEDVRELLSKIEITREIR